MMILISAYCDYCAQRGSPVVYATCLVYWRCDYSELLEVRSFMCIVHGNRIEDLRVDNS